MRRTAAALLLVLASVALVLVVAEIVLRVTGTVTPPLRVRDAKIGEHYLKDFDARVYSGESGRRVRLRFDALGFRGPEHVRDRKPNTKRVAVIGDSMVAALAVEEEETFVAQLEAMLSTRTPERWEVLNFGVSASSPSQGLVLHRELVFQFDVDVVLLAFFVGNDLSDSSRALDHYPRIYFELDGDGLVERGLSTSRSRGSSWLNQHSRFYVWQKRLVNRALHASRETVSVLPPGWWIYSNEPTEPVEEAWTVLERVLAKFRAQVEATGARFAVVILPSGRQIYPKHFEAVTAFEGAEAFRPEYADRRIEQMCRTAQVECLSLVPAFSRAADRQPLLFFNGTGHFTPAGHHLAAKTIAPEVLRVVSGSGGRTGSHRPSSGSNPPPPGATVADP